MPPSREPLSDPVEPGLPEPPEPLAEGPLPELPPLSAMAAFPALEAPVPDRELVENEPPSDPPLVGVTPLVLPALEARDSDPLLANLPAPFQSLAVAPPHP